MLYPKVRGAMLACGAAAMLLATPAESSACLSWLFGGCGGSARTTYRAPYYGQSYAPAYRAPAYSAPAYSAPAYGAPACGSCVPQTVRYVPQTSYRTVYRRAPVTTCGAFCGSDPCTGCPVTYYRPVTSWTVQAVSVPYTTYRLVYTNACSPSVGCSSCALPVSSVGTTLGAGGACCTPSTNGAAGGGVPYLGPSNATGGQAPGNQAAPETFKKEEPESSGESFKPVPDPNTSSSPGPDLADPASRTTMRPIHQAARYHLITSLKPMSKPMPEARAKVDDGGWRAARE